MNYTQAYKALVANKIRSDTARKMLDEAESDSAGRSPDGDIVAEFSKNGFTLWREETVRAKGILDGAENMWEAIVKSVAFTEGLRELHRDGWTLESSYDDYMVLRKRLA